MTLHNFDKNRARKALKKEGLAGIQQRMEAAKAAGQRGAAARAKHELRVAQKLANEDFRRKSNHSVKQVKARGGVIHPSSEVRPAGMNRLQKAIVKDLLKLNIEARESNFRAGSQASAYPGRVLGGASRANAPTSPKTVALARAKFHKALAKNPAAREAWEQTRHDGEVKIPTVGMHYNDLLFGNRDEQYALKHGAISNEAAAKWPARAKAFADEAKTKMTGPKGGVYSISANGRKVYIKR